MKKKSCSECGSDAEVSLCQIVSTVGRRPRRQRCSASTAFCAACLQGGVKLLRGLSLENIRKPLSDAFTELAADCGMQSNRLQESTGGSVVAHGLNLDGRLDSGGLERRARRRAL
jgi:hypothetical protein